MEGSSPARGLASHPLTSLNNSGVSNPASSNSPSGSASGNYSPHSNPYTERPARRTSAGAAVQSVSNMPPSPPPFTPPGSASVGQPAYSAGSCGTRGNRAAADTPGVTSAWPGSTTKGSQSESFAFAPHTSEGISPDVQPFKGTPEASPTQPSIGTSDLLGRAAQNMVTSSLDADTNSECSESAASRSSVNSRGSGARYTSSGGQSPIELLKKAKTLVEKQAAVGGSSRLQRGRKKGNPIATPLDKGIPATATPHNTPMDVEDNKGGDQVTSQGSPAAVSGCPAASAAPSAAATPGSVTFLGKPSVDHTLPSPVSSSPVSPGSRTSVVSIGSVCEAASNPSPQQQQKQKQAEVTPMPDANRKLDFNVAATPVQALFVGGAASPAATSTVGAAAANSNNISSISFTPLSGSMKDLLAEVSPPGSDWSPSSFEKLEASMLDSVTKAAIKRRLVEVDGSTLSDPETASYLSEASGGAMFGEASASGGPGARKGSTLARRSGAALLWLLAGVGLVAAAFLAVQMLPPTTAPPGAWCLEGGNVQACGAAARAYWQQADREPSSWQLLLLRTKWYLGDAWDMLVQRKLPEGVTQEHLAQAWIGKISERQQQEMPLDLALQLFGDLQPALIPPIIRAKLQDHQQHEATAAGTAADVEDEAVLQVQEEAEVAAVVQEHEAAALQHESQPAGPTDQAEGDQPEDVVPEIDDSVTEPHTDLTEPHREQEQGQKHEQPEQLQGELQQELTGKEAFAATEATEPAEQQVTAEETAEQVGQQEGEAEEAATADGIAEPTTDAPTEAEREEMEEEQEPAVHVDEAAELAAASTEQEGTEMLQQAGQVEGHEPEPVSGLEAEEAGAVEVEAAAETSAEAEPGAAAAIEPQADAVADEREVEQEAVEEDASLLEQQQLPPAVEASVELPMPKAVTDVKAAATAAAAMVARQEVTPLVAGAAVAVLSVGCIAGLVVFIRSRQVAAAAAAALAGEEAEAAQQEEEALLSDEETDNQRRQRRRRQQRQQVQQEEQLQQPAAEEGGAPGTPVRAAAAAAAEVAEAAVAAALRILTPNSKPPLPGRGNAEPDEMEAEAAAGTDAAGAADGHATPARARSAAAGRQRRTSSRATRSGGAGAAAAAAPEDGEEVSLPPPSSGRGRKAAATPRPGRLSALPEDQPTLDDEAAGADVDELLLSDEEAPAARRGRRQSAPAAAGRRRASGAAASGGAAAAAAEAGAGAGGAAAAGTPRTTRRSTRGTRTPAA